MRFLFMAADRFGGMHPVPRLLDYEEFMGLVRKHATPKRTVERVQLAEAVGRVCASDVVAKRDIPPFPRSTHDGYAVRSEDTKGASHLSPATLRLVGTSKPARPAALRLRAGEAVRVFTGGEVPAGADAVVPVENTELAGNQLKIYAEVRPGSNVDAAGSDLRRGQVLIRAGSTIRPTDLSLAASQGYSRLSVYRRPSVAILPTGNEIRPVGTRLRRGETYDSNSHGVAALLREAGCDTKIFRPLRDSPATIEAALRRAVGNDLVIFIGGSSAGAEDYVSLAVSRLGSIIAHGVKLSPGRPTLFGKVGETLVVGLPGNPTSSLAVTVMVVWPLVSWLTATQRPRRTVEAVLGSEIGGVEEGFTYFRTVSLKDGVAHVVYRSSTMYSSFVGADGYIVFRDRAPKKGEKVVVNLL